MKTLYNPLPILNTCCFNTTSILNAPRKSDGRHIHGPPEDVRDAEDDRDVQDGRQEPAAVEPPPALLARDAPDGIAHRLAERAVRDAVHQVQRVGDLAEVAREAGREGALAAWEEGDG